MDNNKVISTFYNLRSEKRVNIMQRQLNDAKIVRLKRNALKIVGWSQYPLDDLQNAAARIIKACKNSKEYSQGGEKMEQDLHVIERYFEIWNSIKDKRAQKIKYDRTEALREYWKTKKK